MTDSAAFVLPVTWGSAWMTVSNRALIPVAIFNSFNTKTLHVNISQIAHVSVYFCLTGGMRVFVCVCACLLLSLGLSWCVWWWGWWAVKHLSLFLPKWFPWWTTIRWQGPAGSILIKNKTKTNPPHWHLFIVLSPLLYVCGCQKEDSEYLSLKNRRRPKAMSLRIASMTKTTVKT